MVEAALPTFVVLVAVFDVGEVLVDDGNLGGFAAGSEINRD